MRTLLHMHHAFSQKMIRTTHVVLHRHQNNHQCSVCIGINYVVAFSIWVNIINVGRVKFQYIGVTAHKTRGIVESVRETLLVDVCVIETIMSIMNGEASQSTNMPCVVFAGYETEFENFQCKFRKTH